MSEFQYCYFAVTLRVRARPENVALLKGKPEEADEVAIGLHVQSMLNLNSEYVAGKVESVSAEPAAVVTPAVNSAPAAAAEGTES